MNRRKGFAVTGVFVLMSCGVLCILANGSGGLPERVVASAAGKDAGPQSIVIGVGTASWDYPMHTYYHDSRTQVIYLASEIGTSGPIGALALEVVRVAGQPLENWTIRMKHTRLKGYTTCSLDASDWTVVYQDHETITETGWRWFEFRAPFEYNGVDSLLVDFSHNGTSWTGSGQCSASKPGELRSACAYSDSQAGDPLLWSGDAVPSLFCSEYVPNVTLRIAGGPEQVKLTARDGEPGDFFGTSVAISGDWAIAGAAGDDDLGSRSGSAYVFQRTTDTWAWRAKLTASDGQRGDCFGSAVAISGDCAVVGAHRSDYTRGSACVFRRSGDTWTQEAKLMASDGALDDAFGASVATDGNYVIVGAPRDDDNGAFSGSAYVFRYAGNDWEQEVKLVPRDGAEDDYFGYSVAISGNYIVVGAPCDSDNGGWSGSAYVYRRMGGAWVQDAKLLAHDGQSADCFATSVAVDRDDILIGAPWDNDWSGSAYLFRRTGNSWTEQAKLNASDATDGDCFGASVSIAGDHALVGAYWDSDLGHFNGSAYMFKRDRDTWIEQVKLVAPDGTEDDCFGESVSVGTGYSIVGAAGDEDDATKPGYAYIFRLK